MNLFNCPFVRLRNLVRVAAGLWVGAHSLSAATSIIAPLNPDDAVRHLRLRIEGLPGSVARLQVRNEVGGGSWNNVGDPVLVGASGFVNFNTAIDDGRVTTRFFRIEIESFSFSFTDTGEAFALTLPGPVPLSSIFDKIREVTGRDLFPTNPNCVPNVTRLGPLTVTSPTLEGLFAGTDCPVLASTLDSYDPKVLARLPVNVGEQPDPLQPPAGDVGIGVVEDGWPGDRTLPPLPEPENPVEPRDDNMVRDPNADAEPDGTSLEPLDPVERITGRHFRVTLHLHHDGGEATVVSARECPGDARRPFPPGELPEDALLLVFKGKDAAGGNVIYHIEALQDPFEIHSYEPGPNQTRHAGHIDEADLRMMIPVLPEDTTLAGLTLEIYRVIGALNGEPMTPDNLARQSASLTKLSTVSGAEISRAVAPATGRAERAMIGRHAKAATLKALRVNGPRAMKYNLVFIGDGFRDTASDQAKFNDWVQAAAFDQLFLKGKPRELANAFNVYRVNTYSNDSGVTQVDEDGDPIPGKTKDTALQMEFSGIWERCWMERSANSDQLIKDTLADLVPEWDIAVLVLNQTGGGGCAQPASGYVFITLGKAEDPPGSNAKTLHHELGHAIGKLGDEYRCKKDDDDCPKYSGPEPGYSDLTANTSRSGLKWKQWVPNTRPLPTASSDVAVDDEGTPVYVDDVGAFPGATTGGSKYYDGIFRPNWNSVMNNAPFLHNPIGDAALHGNLAFARDNAFVSAQAGDFDGDGALDLVHINGKQISLYLARPRDLGQPDPVTGKALRAPSTVMKPTWFHTGSLTGPTGLVWVFSKFQKVVPADFDGDGKTDLIVIDTQTWDDNYLGLLRSTGTTFEPIRIYKNQLPDYSFNEDDRYYTGDFDGDGKGDLAIYNGTAWNYPHLAVFRSTGNKLALIKHYLHYFNYFTMGKHERFLVGDVNGDGKSDLVSQNVEDWQDTTLGVFTSTGSGFISIKTYGYPNGTIRPPSGGLWTMRTKDRLYLADVDGNQSDELVLFNGKSWSVPYLTIFKYTSDGLEFVKVHKEKIDGLKLAPNDEFTPADVNGDGKKDLVSHNKGDFSIPYLMVFNSTGGGNFDGHWQNGFIGYLDLSQGTRFIAGELQASRGRDAEDLIALRGNSVWLLRSYDVQFGQDAYYPGWIQNYRYHSLGWW